MGQIAAKTLIDQIEVKAEFQPEIVIEPELIVRASTGPVRRPLTRGMKSILVAAGENNGESIAPRLANSRRRQDG
jgi:LacI family transcriptional regulator